jgi:dipeptidyl aminopeptidase/acylaminoacyl peptidase
MRKMSASICLLLFLQSIAQTQVKRAIRPEDVYRMQTISNPKISPDGRWVLYQMSRVDSVKDRYESKLYMVSTNGSETVQLTEQTTGASMAAWSPDNKYISFLAKGRPDDIGSQLFLMNRNGGEPIQLTRIKGEIQRYRWFPDAGRILFEIRESSTADTASSKVRKPYVIDRYAFKDDSEGYLDNRKTHLYVFDIVSKKLDTLTRGMHNEENAVISPDGKKIAYVSNTSEDPDRNENTDIFIIDPVSGKIRAITTFKGANGMPRFSPDNQYLAYNQSTTESGFNMYDQNRLHLHHLSSGSDRVLSATVDRSINNTEWSPDSRYLYSVVEDDRKRNILQFDIRENSHRYLTNDMATYGSMDINPEGKMVALFSDRHTPNEIYIREVDGFRRLTRVSDEFLAPIRPMHIKGFECPSTDKSSVSGILYLPDSASRKLPLILYIHGGPVGQDEFGFDMSRQVLSSAGYAVAAVNYRGSSGRGMAYTKAIHGDWGNKEVKDIIAVADYLIKTGIADPSRLAIAGWSYGGILTNYTIATDTRFKAAVSGAGSSLQFSMYGSDQYIRQYEEELGKPWKNPGKWMNLSYPFFRVESIRTPTLFMASEDDFNVPVIGAEQMYQAFKSSGIPTELVIYPGQHHGLRVPSYVVHRYRKHLEWFEKYLK